MDFELNSQTKTSSSLDKTSEKNLSGLVSAVKRGMFRALCWSKKKTTDAPIPNSKLSGSRLCGSFKIQGQWKLIRKQQCEHFGRGRHVILQSSERKQH